MNALLETFFNEVHDGVVLVSPDAVVRFVNTAAQSMVSLRAGEALRHGGLTGAIAAARQGLITLPHSLLLGACAGFIEAGPHRVQLMWSPGGQNFVLLIRGSSDSRTASQSARLIGELINQHCRAPLQSFFGSAELAVEALQARNPADAEIRRVVERAISHGKAAVDKLGQLIAIAHAAEGVPVSMEDRVPVGSLIEHAAARARRLAEPRRMRIFVDGAEGELPAVYGSQPWLERAVYELMSCALYCGANGADVLVSVEAAQGLVNVTVRVAGSTASLPSRDRAFTPFFSEAASEGLYARSLGIGLSFARWVIERHGGRLEMGDDEHGIAQFCAELPCGLPAGHGRVDSLAQAQRYAEDLAQLMAGGFDRSALLAPASGADIIYSGE